MPNLSPTKLLDWCNSKIPDTDRLKSSETAQAVNSVISELITSVRNGNLDAEPDSQSIVIKTGTQNGAADQIKGEENNNNGADTAGAGKV